MEAKLDSLKLVLFSPGIVLVDKAKAASEINSVVSGIFDADPVIIPLPEDVPPTFPSIQLKSKDERHKLSIARSRLDFSFEYKESDESIAFPVPNFSERSLSLFRYLVQNLHAKVTRVGFVSNWMIDLERDGAAEFLKSKYKVGEAFSESASAMEFHILTRSKIEAFDTNKWLRIKSARKKSAPEEDRYVTLLVDINTSQEQSYDFVADTLPRFLEESANITNQTVRSQLAVLGG